MTPPFFLYRSYIRKALVNSGGARSDNSSRLTPSSTREDGKEGRVTRKAQQSRSEQPATPSSGPVAPRGELIRRDTEEAPEPPERRRTGGYVADAKTSSHGHVRVASCQERRRGRPQETPSHLKASLSPRQRGQMVAPGKALGPRRRRFRIHLFLLFRVCVRAAEKSRRGADGPNEPPRFEEKHVYVAAPRRRSKITRRNL